MKSALITGVTGQDGSYLAELLLGKGYEVWGTVRRKSSADLGNAAHLAGRVKFIGADMTDPVSLLSAVRQSMPDEIYNLAAQSFVAASWEQPLATAEINALGTAALLEAARAVRPDARFYQASTSELYGLVQETPQRETTPFYPRSPYGVAKLYAHWITKNYRESFGLFACAGILFNHESERRGLEFVTRKITDGVARIKYGLLDRLELGNLSARRDWGHAEDYVRAMWLMLQRPRPDDYVIASGETHAVREFVTLAFGAAGIELVWRGEGAEEEAVNRDTGSVVVSVNPKFFRPAEVELLLGLPEKAERELGWRREVSFSQLVRRMVENDLRLWAGRASGPHRED